MKCTTSEDNDEYLTIGEAEEYTGWSRRTLLNWSTRYPKYFPCKINPLNGRKEFSKRLLDKYKKTKNSKNDEVDN